MPTPSARLAASSNLSDLLRELAETKPDQVAIDDAGVATTYAELELDVRRLARWLRPRLHARGVRVGLVIKDARTLTVAAMGCARSGAVYVPIDPAYPVLRMEQVLRDAGAALVLTDGDGPAPTDYCPFLSVVTGMREGAGMVDDEAPLLISGDDPVSIHYTSGSTGTPKGIVRSHAGRRAVAEQLMEMGLYRPGSRVGIIAAGSLPQVEAMVTVSVLTGATLVPFDIRQRDFGELAAWLVQERVETFGCVPTLFRHLARTLPAGRAFPELTMLALFGETLMWSDVGLARELMGAGASIANAYACSEVGPVTKNVIGPDVAMGTGRVPTGHPTPGCEIQLVDENGEPVASGQGEIVVSATTMPLGYWRRPDLDASVYTTRADGTRVVRTGDIGIFLPDGQLDHLGRLDHVVKIGGNRVDLGDVETPIAGMPEVAAVAVAARPDPVGDLRLVAYVVANPGHTPDPLTIRARLTRRLPGFMLPDQVVLLDELPTLGNGKVDRNALPERPTTNTAGDGLAAQAGDDVERTLAALFATVLGLDEVGIGDDFFELGGDSLRAAQLLAEIEVALGIDLAPSVMVHAATVQALAVVVRTGGQDDLTPLIPIQVRGSKVPVYFVHHGFGSVAYARGLSEQMDSDQPVYGLVPLTEGTDQEAFGTISRAAQTYLRAVRNIRPSGPYALYGQSLGGVIAYEMALQLEAEGEIVSFLGLGDTTAPWTISQIRVPSEPVLRQLRKRFDEARQLGPLQAAQHLQAVARSKYARLRLARNPHPAAQRIDPVEPADVNPSMQERLDFAMRLLFMDYINWKPRPLRVAPVLFRADSSEVDTAPGWRDIAPDLRIAGVPGDHWTMTSPPDSDVLAKVIAEELDAAPLFAAG